MAMDIEFTDPHIALIETEGAADTRLPIAVIQAARQRLSIMRAAPDVRTLQSWKSLGLQARDGTADYLVVLSPQWAMAVRISEKNNVMTVVVSAIEEQLRGAA